MLDFNGEILRLEFEGENIETLEFEGVVVARKPIITTQPASQTITDAQTATLSVVADGLGSTLTYQWYKSDGTAISGATGASYVFDPSSTGSFGFYCRVTGFGGYTQTATATVTVEASTVAPTITKDPDGGSMVEGQPFTASITVDWGGETGSIVWYLDDVAQEDSNSTSFTFNDLSVGVHTIKAKATNSKGSDTSTEAQVTTLAVFISETSFDSDAAYNLEPDCTRIEVQGCGGGGGGGTGSKSVANTSGGGGGGASLVSIKQSNVTGGQFLSITVGKGGAAGDSGENGLDGGNSSIEGTGVSMAWSGGKGGEAGVSASNSAELGRGANGGNNSNGVGGAIGNQTDDTAPSATDIGGGGAGGRFNYDSEVYDKPDNPSNGGDGGGSNGGLGGVPPQGDGYGGKSGGGGGGGNDAIWWDGSDAGSGADGGANGSNGGVNDAIPATGYGNGGGGGHGSGSSNTSLNGFGSAGSGGYIIIRQYRA